MSIRRLRSRLAYENPFMRVREDDVEFADGLPGVYGVVEKPDFALIVPVDADGGLWVVEQFRYAVDQRLVEFPQGASEADPGVEPAALAAAELREETGLSADRWDHLGYLYANYGYSEQGLHVWRAEGLTQGEPAHEPGELGMTSRKVTPDEFRALVAAGRIRDTATVAAFALL